VTFVNVELGIVLLNMNDVSVTAVANMAAV